MSNKEVYGLFNDSFPPVLDGVTLTVQNYVRWLVDRGLPVTVITPWNPFDPAHPDFEMHRYFSLPIYNRHPYRYGYPRVDPFIWYNVRRTPFKIVHAHCPFSSGRIARYASRYHCVPLVGTFHSKYRTDLERSLPAWGVRWQMKRILDFYNACDEVWIPQAAVEDTIREYGYRGQLRVVDNGNDLAGDLGGDLATVKSEARRRLNIPSDRLTLLFVGQHIREKGVHIIIDALGLLKDKVDFEMHFIGTGYATDEMKRHIVSLGLHDRVTLHGVLTDRHLLSDYYAAASLFLFPSMYDNAPLVVREAAMAGTPSILPLGSTAAEVIVNGSNGFLTDATSDAYASLISRLDADRDIIDTVGAGARQSLARSWDDIMNEVFDHYQRIIRDYGNRHR
ncbi:MAG: glycosyltransferase [Muribaculaceae bacterium]|nr:glycosyltransferase [Muribaculaceae bacterium]